MSYQDQYNLGTDPEFTQRLTAAVTDESRAKTDDPLAEYVMRNPTAGAALFMPFVSTAPGFGDAGGQANITDAQILSAIQASWDAVTNVNNIEPFPEPAP